jgi:hypothetical protein
MRADERGWGWSPSHQGRQGENWDWRWGHNRRDHPAKPPPERATRPVAEGGGIGCVEGPAALGAAAFAGAEVVVALAAVAAGRRQAPPRMAHDRPGPPPRT